MTYQGQMSVPEFLSISPFPDVRSALSLNRLLTKNPDRYDTVIDALVADWERELSLADVPRLVIEGDYMTANALLDAERRRLSIAVARESAEEMPKCQGRKPYKHEVRRLGGIRCRTY